LWRTPIIERLFRLDHDSAEEFAISLENMDVPRRVIALPPDENVGKKFAMARSEPDWR
jgi:hypothetical protein